MIGRIHTRVHWAHLGRLSRYLAYRFPFAASPVLVISLPRSGSSWAGEILGQASNAAYLREPVNQAFQAAGRKGTLVAVETRSPDPLYQVLADRAFRGIPAFPEGVVADSRQWSLSERSSRRLVIKEVNPLALEYYAERYRPHVFLLVRHPAAVALSFQKLGWLDQPDARQVTGSGESLWKEHGRRQGAVLKSALEVLNVYPDHDVLTYEDLCANPESWFHHAFERAGLTWDNRIRDLIQERSRMAGDPTAPYDTRRLSSTMAGAWKNRLRPDEIEDLKSGYLESGISLYGSDADWGE